MTGQSSDSGSAAPVTAAAGFRQRYEDALAREHLLRDPAQEQAVAALADLMERLVQVTPLSGWRKWLGGSRQQAPVRGLYLWGGVGRGKTWLMDLFYGALPFEERSRSHFHRFLHHIHEELGTLSGHSDPLAIVAKRIADRSRVICFDEFFVADITDAMLLGKLFEALFQHGVCLVATSNVPPSGLYKDGLQRSRFLPAIALLEKHTEVLAVDGGVDYRLRLLEQAEIYHSPLDEQADGNLQRYFEQIAPETGTRDQHITIEHRQIATRARADGVVWFDFDAVCGGPRSQADYIEIAREYQTVLVSSIPQLGEQDEDRARRFIALVDEFYDHNVKLIVSAAVAADELYAGKRLQFEFQRTRSRLEEMRSRTYLAQPHLP